MITVGVLAAFAVSAIGSASAMAGPLHWYAQGGGKLAAGVPLSITGLGSENQVLKSEAGGFAITITCPHLDVSGTIINPAGGGAGLALQTLLYLSCAVTPTTLECKIPEGMITANTLVDLEGTNAEPTVQFLPDGGTVFVNITFTGCSQSGLNTTYPITGSALGKVNNATSTVTVKEPKAGSMLKFAGNAASLESGAVEVMMAGGGKIEAKE